MSLNAGGLERLPAGRCPDPGALGGALGSNDLDATGLVEVDDDTWTSAGFGEAAPHLELRVSANAGSFEPDDRGRVRCVNASTGRATTECCSASPAAWPATSTSTRRSSGSSGSLLFLAAGAGLLLYIVAADRDPGGAGGLRGRTAAARRRRGRGPVAIGSPDGPRELGNAPDRDTSARSSSGCARRSAGWFLLAALPAAHRRPRSSGRRCSDRRRALVLGRRGRCAGRARPTSGRHGSA